MAAIPFFHLLPQPAAVLVAALVLLPRNQEMAMRAGQAAAAIAVMYLITIQVN
jgi:hypothetical protein